VAPIYENSPFVHQIIAFDRARFGADASYRTERLTAVRAVRADLCLNTVHSREIQSEFLAVNSGAAVRIAQTGDLSNISAEDKARADLGYTRLIKSADGPRTELARHRDFLKGMGIDVGDLSPRIWTSDRDERFAEDLFRSEGLDPARTIGLFAGAQYAIRRYERYGEALAPMCRSRGLRVLALGLKEDAQINERNLDQLDPGTGIDLSGRTTIRESAALLRRCRLAVGAETALAHIACAVGTPNVVLLGGGHFGRFMPYSPLTAAVALPLTCFGCNWHCRYSRPHCIRDVVPAAIETAVRSVLVGVAARQHVFAMGRPPWDDGEGKPSWAPLVPSSDREIIDV
jgi:ADP-heptose:LPS heptosyltransferase